MTVYDQELLRSLVHDIVQVVKSNLKVDWTEPHRDDVRAAVRAAVRRVLHRRVSARKIGAVPGIGDGAGRSAIRRLAINRIR